MSPRKTTGAIFLLAVFFRILYVFLFPPQGTDHEMIHTAVDNLLSGNGLAFAMANPQDLSSTLYQPMNEWPPLVAYLLSFVKAMVGSSHAADMIIMSLGMLFLLLVLNAIMKVLKLNDRVRVFLWILIAANPEPFSNLGITDLYGGLFMLWGTLFCLRFLQQQQVRTSQLIVASFFFFLPAAFRYQYYPVIFAFPVFLIAAAKYTGNKQLLSKSILSFSIVFFLLAAQVAFLYQQTGTGALVAEDKVGFYPENLIWFYPFITKGFLNVSYIENTLIGWNKMAIFPYYIFSFLLTNFILYKLFAFLFKQLRKGIASNSTNTELVAMNLGRMLLLFITSSVFGLLILMALRYSPQINPYGTFTYVNEGRYFIVASLLMMILLSSVAQDYLLPRISFKLPLKQIAAGGFMIFNLALFGKFLYNVTSQSIKDPAVRWVAEKEMVHNEIETLHRKYNLPVVAISSQKYFLYQSAADFGMVKNIEQLKQTGIRTSKPVQLLIITWAHPNKEELQFIKQNGATEVFAGKKCKLYHTIVNNTTAVASL